MEKTKYDYKSKITINCKDNTKRIVNVIGRWSDQMAKELATDLEGSNFSSFNVIIQ